MSKLKKTIEKLARQRFYQDWIAGCFDIKSKDFREEVFSKHEQEYLKEAKFLLCKK